MGHGNERARRLKVDLGVAQALGGSDEFGHSAAHAGKAFGDLVPVEFADSGHRIGQHVHGLRELHEGRTGLDEIGGVDVLHRLRDRFKTDVKLGHQATDGGDATSYLTATEGSDLLHRVNKQRDGSGDLYKSKSLYASSECVERFLKTAENVIEYTSALLELFSPITEEVLNGFLDRIERPTDLLCGQENTTSGEAGEDVATGDIIRDPSYHGLDLIENPIKGRSDAVFESICYGRQ